MELLKVYILAVTKASYGDYCIAGITEEGKWIRPIPASNISRFWTTQQLTTEKGIFLRAGDVLEFNGNPPEKFQHKNHTEDIVVKGKMRIIERLSNDKLINFLHNKSASIQEFTDTINAQGRSLCLVKVDEIESYTTQWEDQPLKPKVTFTSKRFDVNNPLTNKGDYIVKDCKWASLILKDEVPKIPYTDIYVSIGLATPSPFNNVEYPQVIGIQTKVEVPFPDSYPN